MRVCIDVDVPNPSVVKFIDLPSNQLCCSCIIHGRVPVRSDFPPSRAFRGGLAKGCQGPSKANRGNNKWETTNGLQNLRLLVGKLLVAPKAVLSFSFFIGNMNTVHHWDIGISNQGTLSWRVPVAKVAADDAPPLPSTAPFRASRAPPDEWRNCQHKIGGVRWFDHEKIYRGWKKAIMMLLLEKERLIDDSLPGFS